MRRVVEDTQGRHLKLRAYAVGPEANRTYARPAHTRPVDGSLIDGQAGVILSHVAGRFICRCPDSHHFNGAVLPVACGGPEGKDEAVQEEALDQHMDLLCGGCSANPAVRPDRLRRTAGT